MLIQCPTYGMYVLASGSGSGSGSGGSICVRGTLLVQNTDGGNVKIVRVRVLSGHVSPPFPSPIPQQTGDVDVEPTGLLWCASGVPAAGSSDSAAPITVLAWLCQNGVWDAPQSVWCYVGGTNAVSCCPEVAPPPHQVGPFETWPPPPPPLPSALTNG